MSKKIGAQTVRFASPPAICSSAAIVGAKEGEGPLCEHFDRIVPDEYYGQTSFEAAESQFLKNAVSLALTKGGTAAGQVEYILAGDLLNQCVSSTFGIRDLGIPYVGVYGACSTMAESLMLGAMLIDGGFANKVVCATSSHFCSAERQFRFPLAYGGQRPPTAQWTVTGSGAALLSSGDGIGITHVTTGKIVDNGIKDANNMGAAMAPAFADTITAHLKDTHRTPDYYDLIVSGDLGTVGKAIAAELLSQNGYDVVDRYNDCGCMIFDGSTQDTHAGGSGCGCSASVLCGYILNRMREGKLSRVLFAATGALMSPTSTQQGESIPGICHAVAIERPT